MDVLGETGETSLVETKISKIIEAAVADLGFQLVRVLFMGGNSGRNQLQIMVEPVEDREMTVEDCKKLSRHIAALLDVEDPISSAYVLEVSSPGIDRPLTKIEDYERFEGELAKINLRMMRDGRRRFNGRLNGFDEDGKIVLETSFGRFVFAFDEIDSARIDPAEILAMPSRDKPTKDGLTKDRQMSNDKRG
jgi:ribosome maturation factor RimP